MRLPEAHPRQYCLLGSGGRIRRERGVEGKIEEDRNMVDEEKTDRDDGIVTND